MSNDIAQMAVDRIAESIVAGLSKEQKGEAVKKVMTNLEAKAKAKPKAKPKSKPKKTKSKKKVEVEEVVEEKVDKKTKGKKVPEKTPEKTDDAQEDGSKEEVSEMSDDTSMDSVEALSQQLDEVKKDGKVDSEEVVALFQSMMGMVDNLLRAKPGRKPKASLEDRVAARGLQTRRKDKDLMTDTGGTSKGRDREPEQKPSREDVKKNNRTKNKPAVDRDTDTDNDKDVKAHVRQAMISLKASDSHPLDRKAEMWGMPVPEENYYRRVWSSLTSIIATRRGVSEKAFQAYDEIMAEADGMLRKQEAMSVVGRFESEDKRPSFCAECLFDSIGS